MLLFIMNGSCVDSPESVIETPNDPRSLR